MTRVVNFCPAAYIGFGKLLVVSSLTLIIQELEYIRTAHIFHELSVYKHLKRILSYCSEFRCIYSYLVERLVLSSVIQTNGGGGETSLPVLAPPFNLLLTKGQMVYRANKLL